MGTPLRDTRLRRQHRLGPIQGTDLRFLVHNGRFSAKSCVDASDLDASQENI